VVKRKRGKGKISGAGLKEIGEKKLSEHGIKGM